MPVDAKDVILSNGMSVDDYIKLVSIDTPMVRYISQPIIDIAQIGISDSFSGDEAGSVTYHNVPLGGYSTNWSSGNTSYIDTAEGSFVLGADIEYTNWLLLISLTVRIAGTATLAHLYTRLGFAAPGADFSGWAASTRQLSVPMSGLSESRTHTINLLTNVQSTVIGGRYIPQVALEGSGLTCEVVRTQSRALIIGRPTNG